jgi:uncharacterized protein (TIGR02271 family)
VLASAAGGAAVAGIVGALIGLGIPEEEARYYEGEVKAGRTLVTVKADNRYAEAEAILRRYGAYDMQTRGAATAQTTAKATEQHYAQTSMPKPTVQTTGSQYGLSAVCETTTPATGKAFAQAAGTGAKKIQVREEELHAHKQPVEAGEVRVRKEVVTEHKTLEVPVKREEVVIERHPVSGQRVASSDIRPGEEIRIPVKEEQVNVEKQAVVKEEVRVGKREVQDTEKVSGTVRKEQVKVEQEGDVKVQGSNVDVKDAGRGKGKRK